ncbi:MAG: hypothetical protein MJ066_00710 [Clostridia bacterium]|nr:hypothetical protein [Clostridia bacterium]
MIISFFGHSDYLYMRKNDEKIADKKTILDYLEKLVGDKKCDFYLGLYGDFDYFAKECCQEYKKTHQNCKMIAILPYLTSKYCLDDYDESIYPPIEKCMRKFAILKRNEWIVENSDYIICFIKYTFGGANKAIEHARKKKKIVFNICNKTY